MTKYLLRKIYLGDGFGFNFFSFPALDVSVFIDVKNILVFCFMMINMIAKLKVKSETTSLELSRYLQK